MNTAAVLFSCTWLRVSIETVPYTYCLYYFKTLWTAWPIDTAQSFHLLIGCISTYRPHNFLKSYRRVLPSSPRNWHEPGPNCTQAVTRPTQVKDSGRSRKLEHKLRKAKCRKDAWKLGSLSAAKIRAKSIHEFEAMLKKIWSVYDPTPNPVHLK